MLRDRTKLLTVMTVLVALGLGACGDSIGVDSAATVRVLLTDAPIDYVGAALVDFGVVEIIPAGNGPPITLSEDGTGGPVNLLELQNAGMGKAQGIQTLYPRSGLGDVPRPRHDLVKTLVA